MRKKLGLLLIILSVALNAAFVTVWALRALPGHFRSFGLPGSREGVWCPLHRRLGATDTQWRELEPRVQEFQHNAAGVCDEVQRARSDLLALLASPDPDRQAIREKQEEILDGQRRMQDLVITYLIEEKKVLTPAQQRDLFDMVRLRSGCAGHGRMGETSSRGGPRRHRGRGCR